MLGISVMKELMTNLPFYDSQTIQQTRQKEFNEWLILASD